MWLFGDLGFPSVILVNKPLKDLCLSFKKVYQHLFNYSYFYSLVWLVIWQCCCKEKRLWLDIRYKNTTFSYWRHCQWKISVTIPCRYLPYFQGCNFSIFLASLLNGLSRVPPIDRLTSRQGSEAQIRPDSSLLFLHLCPALDHLKAMHSAILLWKKQANSAKLSCFAPENWRSGLVCLDCGHFSDNRLLCSKREWCCDQPSRKGDKIRKAFW